MMRASLVVSIAAAVLLAARAARAQYYQTDFPAEEFRSRHAQSVRSDRRERGRRRPGRAADRRLHAASPAQHLLLPLGHRNARRLPAARRAHEEGDALPSGAQPAARGGRGPRAVGRRRRSRHAHLGRGRGEAAAADGGHELAADRDGRRGRRRRPRAAAGRDLRGVQPGREPGAEPRRAGVGGNGARQRSVGRHRLAPAALRRAAARAPSRAPKCATSTRFSTRCGASRARARSPWCGARRRLPASG